MSAAPHVTRRTIRRQQLREIVPLADSTIYDMEQREFPQRFYLTSRCVVWDLAEVEALARRSAPCLSRKCRQTCSKPRREAAPFAARQTLGSNSSNSIVAGSSIGRYF